MINNRHGESRIHLPPQGLSIPRAVAAFRKESIDEVKVGDVTTRLGILYPGPPLVLLVGHDTLKLV